MKPHRPTKSSGYRLRGYWFIHVIALLAVQTASGYYDPSAQRWINRDPRSERPFHSSSLLRSDGSSLSTVYRYTINDPINFIDSLGLEHVQEPGFTKPISEVGPMFTCFYELATGCQNFGDFHWYGNYGGPGWCNGAPDPGSGIPGNQVGPPAGPPPTDAQDLCYLVHDEGYKFCQGLSDRPRLACERRCDSTLVECLKRSASAPSPGSAWTRGAAIVGFKLRGLISDFKLWLSGS